MTRTSTSTSASSSSSSPSRYLSVLAILCLVAIAVLRLPASTTMNGDNNSDEESMTTNTYNNNNPNNKRSAVGGYSSMTSSSFSDLQSEELLSIANFAVLQHARGESRGSVALAAGLKVTPDELMTTTTGHDDDDGNEGAGEKVRVVVLDAQRQVVAGLNYKLTLSLFKNSICLGGFKVTVYNHFGDLSVISWGNVLDCTEVNEMMTVLTMEDEKGDAGEEEVGGGGEGEEETEDASANQLNALMVEENEREEREEVEPEE